MSAVAAYATIDDLRSHLGTTKTSALRSPAYVAKMLHAIPVTTSVDRTVFVLQRVAGKRVLECGASGPLHDGIVKAAASCVGVDRHDGPGVIGFDLDDVSQPDLPVAIVDVIVCGEILEHLANPGWLLTRLKRQYPDVPVLITVPNAFAQAGRAHILTGTENVNLDHVSWYSYTTLKTLLARTGYSIAAFHWYNGPPYVAEGLIVVTE